MDGLQLLEALGRIGLNSQYSAPAKFPVMVVVPNEAGNGSRIYRRIAAVYTMEWDPFADGPVLVIGANDVPEDSQ